MSASDVLIIALIVLPMLFVWAFVLVDVLRRDDLSGAAKIIWLLAALLLPLLTILIYLLVRPRRPASPRAVIVTDAGSQAPPTTTAS